MTKAQCAKLYELGCVNASKTNDAVSFKSYQLEIQKIYWRSSIEDRKKLVKSFNRYSYLILFSITDIFDTMQRIRRIEFSRHGVHSIA